MKEWLEATVKELVDYPEEVHVRETGGDSFTVLEVAVHAADVGKVIGKQGRTVTALRTLVSGIGAKNRKRATLEILEPVREDSGEKTIAAATI